MSRLSSLVAAATDPASGWDARLWRLWAFYTALAYTVILAIISGLTGVGLDVTRFAVTHRAVGRLLIATGGALLYGSVLGALQWRVLRERLTIPRRSWVRASVIPALIIWILIVVPAGIAADSSVRPARPRCVRLRARRRVTARGLPAPDRGHPPQRAVAAVGHRAKRHAAADQAGRFHRAGRRPH